MGSLLGDPKQFMDKQKNQFETNEFDFVTSNKKISIKLNGNYKILDLIIDTSLFEDKEMLQDLLIAAFNKAIEKVDKFRQQKAENVQKDLFSNLSNLLNDNNL